MSSQVIKNNDSFHLILVAVPIGNLQEISFRALNILKDATIIFCEDTRTSAHLLDLLKIEYANKHLISYHKFNEKATLQKAIEILQSNNIVLISDAGYPCFSDPGNVLVNYCIEHNIFVEVVNGPNAFIQALLISGWSNYPFSFYGFIDWTQQAKIKQIHFPEQILGFYEAVHRINETLQYMFNYFGDLDVVVCKELTKLNETHYYGKLSALRIPKEELKGEFVILINNQTQEQKNIDTNAIINDFLTFDEQYSKANLKQKLKLYTSLISDLNLKNNELYDLLLQKNKK